MKHEGWKVESLKLGLRKEVIYQLVKKKPILAAKLTRNGCNKDLIEGRIRSEKQGCAGEILCVVAHAF